MAPMVGTPVLFVLADGPYRGEQRPGIITQVWNEMEHATHPGMSNLVVFKGQPSDCERMGAGGVRQDDAAFLVTSVVYDANCSPGTWHYLHYPEEAPHTPTSAPAEEAEAPTPDPS